MSGEPIISIDDVAAMVMKISVVSLSTISIIGKFRKFIENLSNILLAKCVSVREKFVKHRGF